MIKFTKTVLPNQKAIVALLKKYGVKKAGVFGSFARGESNKRSDVDILVKLASDKSLLDLAQIEIALEKKMKRKIDLMTYDSIHPRIKKHILTEEIPLL